ncbi:hypothetical protein EFL59_05830 [Weissella confusa]|nr:hypothetical protein [Weissella confusa]
MNDFKFCAFRIRFKSKNSDNICWNIIKLGGHTLKVQVIILGNLERIIHFDTQTYDLLAATPYFSPLTDLAIDFDVLDDVHSGDIYFYDNAGKIRFVVE